METLLREGPWAIGLTLTTMPTHEVLLALWKQHGDRIRKTMPRGRRCWMEDRIFFVNAADGIDERCRNLH
jgi:hypothetical protein